MKEYHINLHSLLSKGYINNIFEDDILHITNTRRLSTNFERAHLPFNSYCYLPEGYRLPLCIDLTIKMDNPGFYLILGDGHINFGTTISDNRRIDDIVEPMKKPRIFHNHIPMNQYVDITIIYGRKEMQILVNNEERFYSQKEKYMKSKLLNECNSTGFSIKLTCDKLTNVYIKSFHITEYDEEPVINHVNQELPKALTTNEAIGLDKPNLENCISLLPMHIQDEVIEMDSFLRSLKPMKFKRVFEKHGNKITYLASDYGFSYSLYPSNDMISHSLNWYIITNGKPEEWHRKDDKMEETLNKISETSKELAERLFQNLKECIGCTQCIVKTPYQYQDKKKLVCHGTMEFTMNSSDFKDVKAFIQTANELII